MDKKIIRTTHSEEWVIERITLSDGSKVYNVVNTDDGITLLCRNYMGAIMLVEALAKHVV